MVTVNVPGYPDGTYSFATLPGYTFPQTTPFVDTNKTVSPYVYQVSQTGGGYSYPVCDYAGHGAGPIGMESHDQSN